MKIEQHAVRDSSSSCATCLNHDVLTTIKQMILNGVDSYAGITSEPLIKDQETNRMAMTNFHPFILSFFDNVRNS